MAETNDDSRIAQEERDWNTPRMFMLGAAFLAACLVVIFAMAYLSWPPSFSFNPWR